MKNLILILTFVLSIVSSQAQNDKPNTITISGRVTDFEGNPIDSALVQLQHTDFSEIYSTYSDQDGNYIMKGVEKGVYSSMYVIRPKEYPKENAVPQDDMRLEFWAWNVIADRDLVINPRYGRLELYGLNAYSINGGTGLWLYVRPMSLGRYLNSMNEDPKAPVNMNVETEHFKAKVYIDDQEVEIRSIQSVEEISQTKNFTAVIGYLINLKYAISEESLNPLKIKVVGENTKLNEKGENVLFYEVTKYQ